ncbi:MAG TPA: hypothetical protein DDW52_05000 [Planctomycetaceae bacterium]|nr:hypothetical protein [Planctomycetaceae bacterium]
MYRFEYAIGIDYSGARSSETRSATLQASTARTGCLPTLVSSPTSTPQRKRNWNRRELATWLAEQLSNSPPVIVGIDHGFSFPSSYFRRYRLSDWDAFLRDFVRHWPTADEGVCIEDLRAAPDSLAKLRQGSSRDLRLTEKWSGAAKSVFQFDVQGSVAKSTHAGIPWLHWLREKLPDAIHFWPFDGWDPPAGKSVLCEAYPSILRKRYPRESRSVDQHDAYSIARWLGECTQRNTISRYFDVPLSDEERSLAEQEGWILGIL